MQVREGGCTAHRDRLCRPGTGLWRIKADFQAERERKVLQVSRARNIKCLIRVRDGVE